MKRLQLLLILPALVVAAELPEEYQSIIQRNVFSTTRVPPTARRSSGAPTPAETATADPAPVPADTTTLLGVVLQDGRATALFAGSSPTLSGARHPADHLGSACLTAADTDGVMLDNGKAAPALHVNVGQTLTRLNGQPWQIAAADMAVRTPTSTTATAPPVPSATEPAAEAVSDGGDILQKMLERRKREMTP